MSTWRTSAAIASMLLVCSGCSKKDAETAAQRPVPETRTGAVADSGVVARPVSRADAAPLAVAPIDARGAAAAPTPDAAPTAAPTPNTAPAATAARDKNSGPTRKLKLLPKTWSRKKVAQYMKKTMNRGLGVKCKHCHDPDDHAAPHKKTKIAREMMKMTDKLNGKYFKGKNRVTCYTCHLGKKKPTP